MKKIDVKSFVDYLEDKPTREVLNAIVRHLESDRYEQIIYNFPNKNYVAASIKYFESIENYEKCQEIVNFVEVHNRLNGTNVKTK